MFILAIDQGTSSTKALLFDGAGNVVKKSTAVLDTHYFANGHVEQDPEAILKSVEMACKNVLEGLSAKDIACVGISNQRETFLLWDSEGTAVYPAIVWSCKRSTKLCEELKEQEPWIRKKTGLIVDPYFSGSKLLWLLRDRPEIAHRIQQGELYFGTVDTWLLFRMTVGKSFCTDHTNASRTLLFNIHSLAWDTDILKKWDLEGLRLPQVKASSDNYGETDLWGLFEAPVPITAMIGDSHAAMFGEACFQKGETKMTLGTGCSLLMHVGDRPVSSKNGLLSTIAWSTPGVTAHAWEGAIVACGSMITWLQTLGALTRPEDSADMAFSVAEDSEVFLVPAFSGLGAPFWQMDRRASFHGLTFGTSNAHLVAATLESICFQIKAVVDAMKADLGQGIPQIAMHGGLSQNTYIRQGLYSLLGVPIGIQDNPDISAQGAAYLAGLQEGTYRDLEHINTLQSRQLLDTTEKSAHLDTRYRQWLSLIG